MPNFTIQIFLLDRINGMKIESAKFQQRDDYIYEKDLVKQDNVIPSIFHSQRNLIMYRVLIKQRADEL
jgi:hypothetical protein